MKPEQNKRKHSLTIKICGALPFVIMSCYFLIAIRLPYLLNMHNMWTYLSGSLATILVLSFYLLFFHKWKDPELNSAMIRYSKKNKTKGLVCILLGSVAFLWMSWGLVGISAYLFSKKPYSELYIFESSKTAGRVGRHVTLVDKVNNTKYSLTLSSLYMSKNFPLKEGDVVCAKGRKSFFGAIIEDFNVGECKLEGFRLELPENYLGR